MLKLGIITDVHGNTKACRSLMKRYEKEACDAIIVPGDLSRTLKDSDIERILAVLTKSKLQVYVMPGNYESKKGYDKAIKKYKRKHIHDCLKKPTATINKQHLVFVPGSDVLATNASFRIVASKKELRKIKKRAKKGIYPILIPKILKYLRKDSMLISHTPCKLPGKNSIDLATAGFPTKYFIYREKTGKKVRAELLTPHHVIPFSEAKKLKRKGLPITIKTVHAGLPALTKAIKKKGVTKFISGHIHEAGRRCVTLQGKKVKPNTWSKHLFYHPGAACDGYGGIVELHEGLARFRNIRA